MPEAPRKVTLPTAILTSAPEDRAARGSGHSLPFLRPLSGSGEEGARGQRAEWPGRQRALTLRG